MLDQVLLNWAARYYPIVRILRVEVSGGASILEVGSGPFGIGKFLGRPFVGCDITFPVRPNRDMRPVVASGSALPFENASFDAVVLSDVLEHVPGSLRLSVVQEALRVTRKVAIFGFPSGAKAYEYDLKLADEYKRRGAKLPEWLDEHMHHQPFPTKRLFELLSDKWEVNSVDNENVAFHNWVMKQEMWRPGVYLFRFLLTVFPRMTERLLQWADRFPCYREIVVVRRIV